MHNVLWETTLTLRGGVNWHDASGCFHLDVSNCLMMLGAG